jgi:hypothetical protein
MTYAIPPTDDDTDNSSALAQFNQIPVVHNRLQEEFGLMPGQIDGVLGDLGIVLNSLMPAPGQMAAPHQYRDVMAIRAFLALLDNRPHATAPDPQGLQALAAILRGANLPGVDDQVINNLAVNRRQQGALAPAPAHRAGLDDLVEANPYVQPSTMSTLRALIPQLDTPNGANLKRGRNGGNDFYSQQLDGDGNPVQRGQGNPQPTQPPAQQPPTQGGGNQTPRRAARPSAAGAPTTGAPTGSSNPTSGAGRPGPSVPTWSTPAPAASAQPLYIAPSSGSGYGNAPTSGSGTYTSGWGQPAATPVSPASQSNSIGWNTTQPGSRPGRQS